MDLRELIRESLPEAVGGLITAAVLLLISWLRKHGNRAPRQKESIDIADPERKNGQYAILIISAAVLVLALFLEVVGPAVSGLLISETQVSTIRTHHWITYDPPVNWEWTHGTHFDLSTSSIPRIDTTRQELIWIHNAGFDGIITFTSKGAFASIPQLAKEQGLSVIMGVWDPRDAQEVVAAIAQSNYVDAYCVGHNGLGESRYTFDELARAIGYIRFHTGRLVTTTEKLDYYLAHKEVMSIGDWVFPDAHVSIKEGINTYRADANRDTKQIIEWARLIAAKQERQGKPVLLKMISYPVNGISNASLEEQSSFFISIFEIRRDVMSDLPGDVSVSVHSAFDMPWKTKWPFHEWEPYAGLLNHDGTPRLAATEIVKRSP